MPLATPAIKTAHPVWQLGRSLQITGLLRHRELISQFVMRDLRSLYHGSLLGFAWAVLHPLVTLSVYTVVFSQVFTPRWSQAGGSTLEFAFAMFCGLVVFNLFSSTMQSAPALITRHRNFVTKTIFPIEVLPVSLLGAQLVHSLIGLAVLIAGVVCATGSLPWTVVFLPLGYIPLVALTLGLAWIISSIGVFARDVEHLVQFAMQTLFFLTPIVYPFDAAPEQLKIMLRLNPLTTIVDHFRRCVMLGLEPDWVPLTVVTILAIVVLLAGYAWFMKIKGAFADVL